MSFHYDDRIYNEKSAREIVPWLIQSFHPTSVVDVGCGTGDWLKVFMDHGVVDALGIDEGPATSKKLKIPVEKYVDHDLRLPVSIHRSFDLVLCLEVAEHLPASAADQLVALLTRLSQTVVFSAAIPGQGGQGHLNEQLPGYWQSLFQKHDFYFNDVIRPLFWNNENVNWCYLQNMFIASKKKILPLSSVDSSVNTFIHPHHYAQLKSRINYLEQNPGIRNSFKLLLTAIRNKISKK